MPEGKAQAGRIAVYLPPQNKRSTSARGHRRDLMTGFSASLGAKPQWIKTTWADLLPNLAAGKCDIAVVAYR